MSEPSTIAFIAASEYGRHARDIDNAARRAACGVAQWLAAQFGLAAAGAGLAPQAARPGSGR